jgi:hypothetical protein
LEDSYNTAAGAIWNEKIEEALNVAESYSLGKEISYSSKH